MVGRAGRYTLCGRRNAARQLESSAERGLPLPKYLDTRKCAVVAGLCLDPWWWIYRRVLVLYLVRWQRVCAGWSGMRHDCLQVGSVWVSRRESAARRVLCGKRQSCVDGRDGGATVGAGEYRELRR